MFNEDRAEFTRQMISALQAKQGQDASKDLIEFWWGLFEAYSIEAFATALRRAVLESRGRLEPAKVMAYLPDPLGHPSAEAAWNAAPKTESETAYVTNQMMTGLAAADDSISRGDMVGARMCFIEVYNREVASAKVRGERAKFWITEGRGLTLDEKSRAREQAVLTANAQGWISNDERDKKLDRLESTHADQLALEKLSDKSENIAALQNKIESAKKNIAGIKKWLREA